jgi:hypothetical protein
MRNKLILFICLTVLPLTAHTQKQYNVFSNSRTLDSLSVERRLVVLGVKSLEYYVSLNGLNQRILSSQRDIILHNEKEIAHLIEQNEGLSEGLNEGLRAKKRWQKATLYSVGLNVTFLATLYVLSR